MADRARRAVVVGGGIAGLTAAYRLCAGGPLPGERGGPSDAFEVILLEASDRLGGKLAPLAVGDLVVEGGADSFVVRKPWAIELCRELALEGDLAFPAATGASVWARGRLVPYPARSAFGVPSEVEELLRWPGLSLRGRLRALGDLYRPKRAPAGDESVASLAARRMGRECAQVLIGPLLSGINAADPERLSVAASFPELAEWERIHGSLIRGAKAARRSAEGRASVPRGRSSGDAEGALFATLGSGLGRLVDTLAERIGLGRVRTSAAVTRIVRRDGRYTLDVAAEGGGAVERLEADAVVLAVPAGVAASMLEEAGTAGARVAARELAWIPYVSTAVIALAYGEGTADRLPEATGFLVPPGSAAGGERTVVTACTWLSRKWPTPSFGDRAVVRAFVGRAGEGEVLERSDQEVVAAVVRDLEAIAPIGAMPEAAGMLRWNRSMPQYEVGHLDRLERIERGLEDLPGVELAGSAYRGVGIADCVRQGTEAAVRVRAQLEGASAGGRAGIGESVEAT